MSAVYCRSSERDISPGTNECWGGQRKSKLNLDCGGIHYDSSYDLFMTITNKCKVIADLRKPEMCIRLCKRFTFSWMLLKTPTKPCQSHTKMLNYKGIHLFTHTQNVFVLHEVIKSTKLVSNLRILKFMLWLVLHNLSIEVS